jgi:hypothetical protein
VLLEYGYGKPQQTINHRVIRSLSDLTDEELDLLMAEELEKAGELPLIEGKSEE